MTAFSMLRRPFSDEVAPRLMAEGDRGFLATTGISSAAAGILLGLDSSARSELFLGWFWPWWWVVAGLGCVLYALRPHSVNLHALSGAALAIAAFSRAVQLGLAAVMGDVPSDRMLRTCGGVLVFLLLGRLVRRQWLTLQPWPDELRARR